LVFVSAPVIIVDIADLFNDVQRPDKTRYAGSTAFRSHRAQFRENGSERIVEHACTGFAHDPQLTI
jgi:hypothetical protein